MSIPYEDLSRLLDGELSDAEAEALLERIDAEPALAEAWEAMQQLPMDLAALPDLAPPPDLDEALLRPRLRWQSLAPWALAAALVIALVMPKPEPTYTLLSGTEVVEGPALVQVGEDVTIDVRGVAKVSVEPSAELARVASMKEDDMNPKLLIAAATGAAITVTVYEGSAILERPGDEATTIEAGQETRFPGTASAATVERPKLTQTSGTSSEDPQARIAELESELQRARFEKALADGRVLAAEGSPQAFPSDLPTSLGPDGFPEAIRRAVLENGVGELVEVDCSEYPCMATITVDSDLEDWGEQLEPIAEAMKTSEEDHTSIWASGFGKNDEVYNYWTFAIVPEGEESSEDVHVRTAWRADQKTDDISRQLDEMLGLDE